MQQQTLHQSRIKLMRSLGKAKHELVQLGWKIKDGGATREDALAIADFLMQTMKENSADTLTEMESIDESNKH